MSTEQAYQETLDYLYSFIDYSLQRNFRYAPEKFDLGRMHALLQRLGNPHKAYPLIHVAGSKGKGSVSAFCASALQAAGYTTGLYTSPHLQDYTERIQVNGAPISHDELNSLVQELKPHFAAVPQISTFEITTALGFEYFARRKVNAAVIEVGLGGRLDATNVIMPVTTAITALSYEHTQILGNTLTEIAAEKAGIIKPGVPVVLAPQDDEARQTVERIAAERGSPLIQVGRDVQFEMLTNSLEGQSLRVWNKNAGESLVLEIPLLGRHQVENAAVACGVLWSARQEGLAVSDEAIQRGFSVTRWPGRFEILRRDPPVVIDSAHNRDSARKLRLTLEDYFPGWPVVLVIGASEDKDIQGIFTELVGDAHGPTSVSQVIATQAMHPRAIEPDTLTEIAERYGYPAKVVMPVAQALREALRLAGKNAVVLATGSLFVVAEVRTAWQQFQLARVEDGRLLR